MVHPDHPGGWWWGRPKRLISAEDWAPYGIGEPDADGWYPDYRPVPAELRPVATGTASAAKVPEVDGSVLAIVTHWRLVVADMAEHFTLDLYDPAVLGRPWPGVRTMIFALLDMPESRLRRALTIREVTA